MPKANYKVIFKIPKGTGTIKSTDTASSFYFDTGYEKMITRKRTNPVGIEISTLNTGATGGTIEIQVLTIAGAWRKLLDETGSNLSIDVTSFEKVIGYTVFLKDIEVIYKNITGNGNELYTVAIQGMYA